MRYILTICTNFKSDTAKLGSVQMHNASMMPTKWSTAILTSLLRKIGISTALQQQI